MDYSTPGFPVLHYVLEFAQTHVHWIGDAMQPFHPLSPLLLLSIFPSIRVFSNESAFPSGGQNTGASASSSVLPMNIQGWLPSGLTGLISLLSKGLKSLLQHHSSKASLLQCSTFFRVQLSHLHMTTGKTRALTIWTIVGKVMSLLNMLSRFVIAFLPRSKHLLISWLAVTICSDFGAQENKVCHCFHCFPDYLP